MTYCVLDLETREVIDTRNVVSIPNNFPFRDAYKIPASIIRLDYETWPELMPQEKISMKVENMLLKIAPKDGFATMEDPKKVQIPIKDKNEDPADPNRDSNIVKVTPVEDPDTSEVLSPISSNSTFTPMTNFDGPRSPDLDNKHDYSDGMSETVVLKKVPPLSPETKSKDPDDPTADLGTNLKVIQDPLNLSNVNPEQEEKIRKLKVHKFKVNGQNRNEPGTES